MSDELKSEYRQVRFRCAETDLPSVFHIITAFNPDGRTVDRHANEEADNDLRRLLANHGIRHFRVTGGSPDFAHAESGFGITCTLDEALEVARKFHQDAVFTVRKGRVYLVSAKRGNPDLEEVGSWTDLSVGR